ncbi:MAG: hypothetical protein E7013_04270 [Alphaproteobacteria bacterium]|nr:hypothetical protein [Alphaproteobacteria bacterium]
MQKENKTFYELFPDVCRVIDRARKNYYLDVSEADKKIIKKFYDYITNTNGLSDEEKKERTKWLSLFVERLNKTDDLPISSTDFDITQHLKRLNSNLGNLGSCYIEDYANTTQYVALNSRNLFRTDTFLSQDDKEFKLCKKQIDKLLNLFMKGNSKTSVELKALLKEYNLEIKITDEDGCNGSLDFYPEKKKAVLVLDKGLFKQDESVQAFMLAHELGHFIDYANRPKGTPQYIHQVTEECFADIMATELVKTSGFDLSKIIDLFNQIENDPRHPKKEDRIAAIKAIDTTLTYSQQQDRVYYLIKKTQSLLKYKSSKSSLNENLNALQKDISTSKEDIFYSLKNEQKNMEEDDIPTAEYISQRTADVLYRRFAKRYFISDQSFERGYCTSLPLLLLKTVNPLTSSLIPSLSDPKEFAKEIKQNFPDCIYSSTENQSLSEILKDKNISSNAFVIFDLKKMSGTPEEDSTSFHTMIFKGVNEKGDCLCDGFDNEQHQYVLNKYRQCGYVIDVFKLLYKTLRKADNTNYLTAHLSNSLSR